MHPGLRYPVAALAVGTAALLRWAAQTEGHTSILLPFVGSTVVTAWLAGAGPALMATLLGAVVGLSLFAPEPHAWPLHPAQLSHLAFYGLACLFCILTTISLERSRREAWAAAAARRLNEERYRALVSASTAAVWITDADGNIATPQPGWTSLTGRPWPEQGGSAWLADVAADDAQRVRRQWTDGIARGEPIEITTRLRDAATDQHRWVVLRAVPRRDERGAVSEWIGTVTDVHDELRFEHDLRENQAWLLMAHRAAEMGTWARELDSGRIVWSDGMENVVGATGDDPIDHVDAFYARVHPDDIAAVREAVRRAEQSGGEYEIEYRVLRPDGAIRWLAERGQMRADPVRKLNRLAGVTLDVTERKESEARARELRALLMDHQHKETQRVEQELERARDQLVRQTRLAALGQLSGSIAHDLRNPLGVIRNAAYLLRRRLAKTDIKPDLLIMIDEEVKTADTIITNLMEMTRGRDPQCAALDLGGLVSEVTTRLDSSGRMQWRTEFSENPFELWCDPSQFRQVLNNLLQNAISAMKGKGEVTIAAWRSEEYDFVEVRDQGPGIPSELRARIFEPLVTGERSRKGLGLMICRQVAERHGGAISVEDGPTDGATLRVSLPRRPEKSAPVEGLLNANAV